MLFLGLASAAGQQLDDAFVTETHEYLRRLGKLGFSGVVAMAEDGAPVLVEGYGPANRETGAPWTPATVSTVGSITKQFTAAAILLLQEEGRLSVSDPITEYFDDVPEDKRSITLHQLLTHSSGIVDLEGFGDWDPITREAFVRGSMKQDLEFAPGEGYQYSNAGFSLLGAIIEQLTGDSYEAFLRTRLFVPNGMYETGYILPEWGEGRIACGYADGERWGTVLERPLGDDGPYWVLRANGGIHSTAYDMLRWARALLEGRVLSEQSMAALWQPHVHEGGDFHYGYGWSITSFPVLGKVVTHNGGNGILFADLAILPETGVVLFIQTNVVADFPLAQQLLVLIGRRLAGAPYPDTPDVIDVEAGAFEGLRGRYALEGGGVLTVTPEASALLVEADGPRAFAMLHSSRPVDLERADRLSARLDGIVTAFVGGDFDPIFEAYGTNVSIDRLRNSWTSQLQAWEDEHGALRGHEILGSAMRPQRDVTVVRFQFERGHADRVYVWDMEAQEQLLGYSRRGLDTRLRCLPVGPGVFASWDRMTGESRPLRIDDDGMVTLGTGEQAVRGRRR